MAPSVASLVFPGGPALRFRLNPKDSNWNYKVLTNVTETMGGRVIQVIGATLSDLVIVGEVGEQRGTTHITSWRLAEGFFGQCVRMMQHQSIGADGRRPMVTPAVFSYSPLDISLHTYIKSIADADGQAGVSHRTGKFSYGYQLTLFVVPDASGDLKVAGTDAGGVLDKQRQAAIEAAMSRIADGIGWKFSDTFNGPSLGSGIGGSQVLGQGISQDQNYYDNRSGEVNISVRTGQSQNPGRVS